MIEESFLKRFSWVLALKIDMENPKFAIFKGLLKNLSARKNFNSDLDLSVNKVIIHGLDAQLEIQIQNRLQLKTTMYLCRRSRRRLFCLHRWYHPWQPCFGHGGIQWSRSNRSTFGCYPWFWSWGKLVRHRPWFRSWAWIRQCFRAIAWYRFPWVQVRSCR